MQNSVPAWAPVEREVADRALAGRRDQYETEVRRLIDAAFVVMRRGETLDPSVRDIVRQAGLSNQAFYRHFTSKDALLLAVLADGRRRLVSYLVRRVGGAADPAERVRRFVDAIMAQARDREAADATRPFAVNGQRLSAAFPAEVEAGRAQILDVVRPAVHALGGDDHDVEMLHDLVMARMHDALVQRRTPDGAESQRVVDFCLAGFGRDHRGT